jgi:hypothetical protein
MRQIKKKKKIFTDIRMTNEETEFFIKYTNVIRDTKNIPSRRRYFKSDRSIIAETK